MTGNNRKNTDRRNTGGKQPISQHPLFPAIVALWCGALAGLSSIALRPALIERAILATGLDTWVPLASPPLGATFRILFALSMTGLGGLVGAVIAHRIARPQPAKRERARRPDKAHAPVQAPASRRTREMADTPAQAAEPAAPRTPARTGGRRALANMELEAIATQDAALPVDEHPAGIPEAPMAAPSQNRNAPPVATPNSGILHVRQFDPSGFEAPSQPAPMTAADISQADEQIVVDQIMIGAEPEFLPNTAQGIGKPAEQDADSQAAEQVSEPLDTHHQAQIFRLPLETAQNEAGGPARAGQGLFDAYSQALAARANEAASAPSAIATLGQGEPDADAKPGFSLLAHNDEPAIGPADASPLPGNHSSMPIGNTGARSEAEARSAAERIAQAELGELSHLELLERLALAMSQRREELHRESMAQPAPEPQAQAQSFAPVAMTPDSETPEAPFSSGNEQPETPPVLTRMNSADAPEITAMVPPFHNGPEGPTNAKQDFSESELSDSGPAQPAVPAAMRPVDFEALEEEDDHLPGYIPPRHIGGGVSGPAPVSKPAADLDAADEAESEHEEERALEQGYSSLLNLSRPAPERQEFIRIEEAETSDEIEPVVIFPGEEAQATGGFIRRIEPVNPVSEQGEPAQNAPFAQGSDGKRPFDAPHRQTAEESEQALRAALATLQRMSGAA